jgi:hypothetical protein
MNQPGGVNNSGHNFCNTTLDDESTGASIQSITPAQAPYATSFKPNALLSAFDGQNPNGTWTLNVSDRAVGDLGSVRTFSLIITSSACSTTAQATPIEVQSGPVQASLRPGGDSAASPFDSGASLLPLLRTEGGPWADQESGAISFARSRRGGPSRGPYTSALPPGPRLTPVRSEGEAWRSVFMLRRYENLFRLLTG